MGFISPLAILQVSAKIVDSKFLFNKDVIFPKNLKQTRTFFT